MADVIGTSYASISGALNSVQTLSGARSASLRNQSLPDGVTSSPYTTQRVTLSQSQASEMMSLAVYVGESILNILKDLKSGADLSDSSLAGTYAGVLVGQGTRISVVTLQAGMDRTLEGLETLIKKVAQGNANILSSTSNDITIQTSQYGGKFNVTPLAMDVKGLGLENLDLHSSTGRYDAIARLDRAILDGTEKLLKLKALYNALSDNSALANTLRTLNAGTGDTRGVLVDVTA